MLLLNEKGICDQLIDAYVKENPTICPKTTAECMEKFLRSTEHLRTLLVAPNPNIKEILDDTPTTRKALQWMYQAVVVNFKYPNFCDACVFLTRLNKYVDLAPKKDESKESDKIG